MTTNLTYSAGHGLDAPMNEHRSFAGAGSLLEMSRVHAGPDDEDGQDRLGPGGVGVGPGRGGEAATKAKPKVKKPSMYRVLILNDDYTPMEFVVYVLERYFNKSREQATMIMLHVHQHGVGVCGVFSYEVAETKVAQVLDLARRNEHPLQCTMEKD
jgi:ATP-dependent Clp protease adaptor protein ClpS